jgi:hypothetical protein
LSELERLTRTSQVARRDLENAEIERDKLERQIQRVEAGEFSAADRDHFARQHSAALVRVTRERGRLETAEAAQVAVESTLAKFQPPDPEPEDDELLSEDELSDKVAEIKRQAGLQRPA